MIFLANLRASSTPWLILPGLIGLGLYVTDQVFREAQGYGVGAGETAALGVVAISPVVAGAAAWEAGRQQRLGDLSLVRVRGSASTWLGAVAPVLILHLVLVGCAVALARFHMGVWPEAQGWWGVLHLLLLPWGWLVIGWALGVMIPRTVAAPVAAAVPWVALAATHAMSAPFWGHLGGFITEGSTLTDVLDPLVFLVPWSVTAALAGAVMLLIGARRRPWLALVSAAVAMGTLVTGRAVVSDWGHGPLRVPRAGHTVCAGRAPVVCLPEEYAEHLDEVRRSTLPRLDALREAGLPAPRTIGMASRELGPVAGTWPLSWSPGLPPGEFDVVLARAAVGGTAARHGVRDCGWPSIADVWAMVVMGTPERAARDVLVDEEWAELRRVRALPAPQQADWFTTTAREQRHCAVGS
ncbi:DUF7224 domain-containing protein [Streptomyces sp. LE64]|uniref:DUF7224 domain-containing protein n=1 Tax=Streptomyces sp. LE64 TaxID=3448653 RepID=UPI004042ABAB